MLTMQIKVKKTQSIFSYITYLFFFTCAKVNRYLSKVGTYVSSNYFFKPPNLL